RFWITTPLALLFVFGLGDGASLTAITGVQLLTLIAIALTTGMVALWIYYRGLRTTRASVSAIVELAFPMTAVAIDYFLYGNVLSCSQYFASLVLFFAMYNVAKLNFGSLADDRHQNPSPQV